MNMRNCFLFGVLGLLSACGGGSSGGGGGSTTADVQGIWHGTYTVSGVSGSTDVQAAIANGGYAFFYDANGFMYVLPKLTGSTTLSGTLTGYAPAGDFFTGGLAMESFDLTGTVSDASIAGTFSGNGVSGTFTLTPFTPYSHTASTVSGSWQGFYAGSGSPGAVALTMHSNGSFTGNDANGCALSGALKQVTGENLFNVNVTSKGSGCAGTLNGLAYESSTDTYNFFGGATGTYYYVGVSNAGNAFVAELKAP